jgi:hypothetical protein
MLFILPILPFMPPIVLFIILLPAFIPFIIPPMDALVFAGRAKAFVVVGMIGCCEKDETPLPGGGFRLKPDEPRPEEADVAGGGGSENEEEEARLWPMPGRWSREIDMDDMGVLRPVPTVFAAGGDAQGLELEAVPQFRELPVEEGWLSDGPVVDW